MGSTYGNLFNEIIILIQGLCGVLHVIMNSTGLGVGEREGTASGAGCRGHDEIGESGMGRGK